ncbi:MULTISPECIES: hypothetical protein [Bacillus]|uniref:hypothetical protein n=1 Tax=Bacillus TaxID=1386 RepID=UPI0021556B75|nr:MULTISPECIES: hypothetical protein [Bacillus]MCR6611156.1 hypothetical protein [Bacillus infantis]MDT0163339.1 hypothetical protein [Bacillus sp. AG4(2022)]
MKAVIVSGNKRVRKSLMMLLQAYPELEVFFLEDYEPFSIPDDTDVVIMDIDSLLDVQQLPYLISSHSLIFYSRSKEFSELVDWLHVYNADFINVYTPPDCVLHLIKKACSRRKL